ncbi:hypothetical protein [Burkholderia gladioli]|nr:hypothetical protein [Burkholderia gladioli]
MMPPSLRPGTQLLVLATAGRHGMPLVRVAQPTHTHMASRPSAA